MSRPTIIINDLDAERIDILLEQPAYAGLPIADALNAELDRAQMFARRDATRRGDNEQPG
jgi:regulator of nucleoside diphosphate kinase